MLRLPTRVRRRLAVGLVNVLLLGVLAAAEPTSIEPLPGEVFLTEAEQAEALRGADRDERARLARLFEDEGNVLPVAYTRALFRVDIHADGTQTVSEVGTPVRTPGSNLVLPDLRMAASSGSVARFDLYVSVGIGRLSGSGYRWVIANYFRWRGSSGIDACNVSEDSIATAWAGGLALYKDATYGYYQPFGGTVNALDIYRSDATANLGVGWSFHELKMRGSQVCTNVNWGEGDAYVTEQSWQDRISNVTTKYVHTKGNGSYSLGFSIPGGGPSISVTPADSNQWSVAAFATYNH